jgi:hypothetical protein
MNQKLSNISKEYTLDHVILLDSIIIIHGWKHGKVYRKSCLKNTKFKNKQFSWKHKYIQILFKFHLKNIKPSIGFIINQLFFFKNFGIIK